MKQVVKKLFLVSLFLVLFLFVNGNKVSARVSENDVFKVQVGEENLSINYDLVESKVLYDSDDQVVGKMQGSFFSVSNGWYIVDGSNVLYPDRTKAGTFENDVATFLTDEDPVARKPLI